MVIFILNKSAIPHIQLTAVFISKNFNEKVILTNNMLSPRLQNVFMLLYFYCYLVSLKFTFLSNQGHWEVGVGVRSIPAFQWIWGTQKEIGHIKVYLILYNFELSFWIICWFPKKYVIHFIQVCLFTTKLLEKG